MAVADINFVSNTYAGEALKGVISNALLMENGLAADGLVTLIPNVKGPKKFRKAGLSVSLNDPTPLFSGAAGDIDLDEVTLSPVEMGFDKDFDLASLADTWEVAGLQAGAAQDGDGTKEFNAWLEQQLTDQLSIASEKLYARGKSQTSEALFTPVYPGIVGRLEAGAGTKLLAVATGALVVSGITIATDAVATTASTATLRDGDIVTIIGANALTLVGGLPISGQSFQITVASATTFTLGATTTGTATTANCTAEFINESNVVAHFTKVYNWIPAAVRDNVNILIPEHVKHAYIKAVAAVSLEKYTIGTRELDFLGEKMNVRKHWNPNTIAVFEPSNMLLGVDLVSDQNEFWMKNMKDVTGDRVIRVRARMKSDVAVCKPTECVYMRPA